jgi:hypothetical protein
VAWDGGERLFIACTATGTQGSSDGDYRRFCTNGWLRSYTDGSPAGGGGAKVGIVLTINPDNGAGQRGSFITAVLSSGKTNSASITGFEIWADRLVADVNCWFGPRRIDKSRMTHDGGRSSPFAQQVDFPIDLGTALGSRAVFWDRTTALNQPGRQVRLEVAPSADDAPRQRFSWPDGGEQLALTGSTSWSYDNSTPLTVAFEAAPPSADN